MDSLISKIYPVSIPSSVHLLILTRTQKNFEKTKQIHLSSSSSLKVKWLYFTTILTFSLKIAFQIIKIKCSLLVFYSLPKFTISAEAKRLQKAEMYRDRCISDFKKHFKAKLRDKLLKRDYLINNFYIFMSGREALMLKTDLIFFFHNNQVCLCYFKLKQSALKH